MADPLDDATPRTRATLTRLARLKGYPDPKPDITEGEAKDAIEWLTSLKPDEQGRVVHKPAVPGSDVPHMTLRGWHTKRP